MTTVVGKVFRDRGCGVRERLLTVEPVRREDGRCARPGCGKMVPTKAPRREVELLLVSEPFCSSSCCRIWQGLDLPAGDKGEQDRDPDELPEK